MPRRCQKMTNLEDLNRIRTHDLRFNFAGFFDAVRPSLGHRSLLPGLARKLRRGNPRNGVLRFQNLNCDRNRTEIKLKISALLVKRSVLTPEVPVRNSPPFFFQQLLTNVT